MVAHTPVPEVDLAAPRAPRPLRTGIWQPRQPAFWLLAVMTAIGVALTVQMLSRADDPAIWGITLIGLAVEVVILGWIAFLLPSARVQPRSLRLGALFLGGVTALGIAAFLNSAFGSSLWQYGLQSFEGSITAPVSEDALRFTCLIGVLALAATRRLSAMDGVVYGFLVGAGFELMENVTYSVHVDEAGEALQSVISRMTMGFGLHALWTAVAGGALAYIWSRKQAGLSSRWWLLVPAYLLPMLMHMGWDAPSLSVIPIIKYIECAVLYAISITALVVVARLARRDELRRYGVEVGGSAAIHTRAEWKSLGRAGRRARAEAVLAEEERSRTP